jgi:hypothetical protein
MEKESQIQLKIKKLSSFIPPVAEIAASAATIPEKLIIEPSIPVGIFIQEHSIFTFSCRMTVRCWFPKG